MSWRYLNGGGSKNRFRSELCIYELLLQALCYVHSGHVGIIGIVQDAYWRISIAAKRATAALERAAGYGVAAASDSTEIKKTQVVTDFVICQIYGYSTLTSIILIVVILIFI